MPKKSLGQNFLIDRSVIADLLETAQLAPDDITLEIGAGTGNITKELAKRVKKVVAVEFDRDLIPTLSRNLQGCKNVEIINADILDLQPTTYHLQAILGAVPYQITSPLIHKMIFEQWPKATLLVQKEVAEKICAKPPHASYLSNFVSAFAETKIVKNVPPTAFRPQPTVESSIIMIAPKSVPVILEPSHSRPVILERRPPKAAEAIESRTSEYNPSSEILSLRRSRSSLQNDKLRFSRFLHRGFQSPRKMLNKVFPKEVLLSLGIDPTLRPENLTLEDWLTLYWKCTN